MNGKHFAKIYFMSCGVTSLITVIFELIFKKYGDNLASTLMESYLFILILLYILLSVDSMRMGKKSSTVLMSIFTFILVFIRCIIKDVLEERDINILMAVIISAMCTVVYIIARLATLFYEKSKNKRMNQKLKEYQDNNKD